MNALLAQELTLHRRSKMADSARRARTAQSLRASKDAGTSRPRPDLGAFVNRPRRPERLSQKRARIGKIETQPYIELRRSDVVCRALRLWKTAGRPAGRDLEFWLQAEVELLSERAQKEVHRLRKERDDLRFSNGVFMNTTNRFSAPGRLAKQMEGLHPW